MLVPSEPCTLMPDPAHGGENGGRGECGGSGGAGGDGGGDGGECGGLGGGAGGGEGGDSQGGICEQSSHRTSGSVVKHHGPSSTPLERVAVAQPALPGLRQKFCSGCPTPAQPETVVYVWSCGDVTAQCWHGLPVPVWLAPPS